MATPESGPVVPRIPNVTITADMPLAAEMLEHWAAKLVVSGQPGDLAQKAQAAAEAFRAWKKAR